MSDPEQTRNPREERRRQKELDEARKAGTLAPELDEDGKAINPHIPNYIKDAPWYASSGHASLKHQRKIIYNEKEQKSESIDGKWYARGQFQGPAVTKFRKGACENCGAMTHKTKDCVERPRKIGAKWNGSDIRPDEIIREVDLDFDGKHDRWNGYDPAMYKAVMDKYEAAEEARRIKDAKENAEKASRGEEVKEAADADKEGNEEDAGDFVQHDARARTTVRNLRIREDRAKYLHNLSLDSAYYDPKSRAMHDNPYEGKNPEDVSYAGDNFTRGTGDATKLKDMQVHAWEMMEKGDAPNMFASPSEASIMFEEMKKRKEELANEKKQRLVAEYGGEEHITKVPPKALLIGQTEVYQEYAADGTLIKGPELESVKAAPRSKYQEDVYLNNHTSVWGSYFEGGRWGFACCHQMHKQSFCIGLVPAVVKAPVVSLQPKASRAEDSESDSEGEGKRRKKSKKSKSKSKSRSRSPSRERGVKRKYNSFAADDSKPVSEKDLEEYRRDRDLWDDPMKNMKGNDDEIDL